ncbi:MAG: hypothetical protein HRT45_14455 [Bdellovibrionales bacterium]|nr:hypothetical protein [Bdellovibrionales bacterium]
MNRMRSSVVFAFLVFGSSLASASGGPSCGLELTHDIRAAASVVPLVQQLSSDLEELTNGGDLGVFLEALGPFRPSRAEPFEQLLSLFGEEDPVKEAVRDAFTVFGKRQGLVEEMAALLPSDRQSVMVAGDSLFHLTLAHLISGELRRARRHIELPQVTAEMSKEEMVTYSLAMVVLEHHRLCLRSPVDCHPYIKNLGRLYTLFEPRESENLNLFPPADSTVPGAYLDVATGVLFSIIESMPHFERDRDYLLLDNSPFVVAGLDSLAAQYELDRVNSVRVDASNIE